MDPRIRVILKIIEERKGLTPLVPNDTGKLLGLSEAHFLRLFHRQVGITFQRYLRQVRMNRAAELLKNPAISIKGIASDCGYNDISNFYRDFKQVHAINPRQARFELLAAGQVGDHTGPAQIASAIGGSLSRIPQLVLV